MNKSLLKTQELTDGVRYVLLESTRAFAAEKLKQWGDEAAGLTRLVHAHFVVGSGFDERQGEVDESVGIDWVQCGLVVADLGAIEVVDGVGIGFVSGADRR